MRLARSDFPLTDSKILYALSYILAKGTTKPIVENAHIFTITPQGSNIHTINEMRIASSQTSAWRDSSFSNQNNCCFLPIT